MSVQNPCFSKMLVPLVHHGAQRSSVVQCVTLYQQSGAQGSFHKSKQTNEQMLTYILPPYFTMDNYSVNHMTSYMSCIIFLGLRILKDK